MRKNLQENFYKRLKQLGGVTTSNNPSTSLSHSTLVDYQRAQNGIALGIVKENHNYFIKKASTQDEKIGVEDFAYIGGIENKFKYQYNSLAEAEKNRNFYIKTLNESSSKQFKKIVINEDIAKAQTNGDSQNPDKSQKEADKVTAGTKLADTAPEKEPGKVPSAKEIGVNKQATAKVVDDTKESKAKAIGVNKQATAKVVKENFDKAPFPPSEDGAAAEPAVPSPSDVPQGDPTADAGMGGGDDVNTELDAAASALDDLGAGSAESPEASLGGEEPAAGAMDGAADASGLDSGIPTDGEGAVKDIEKLTGKLTQKIRSTDLTPEMSKGFLKSFITAFEDKLSGLEHEDRKELATAILKDKADDEMGIGDEVAATASTDDAEEKEIEETINAHLAEMGLSESDVNIEGSAESSDAKPFKEFVKSRGYNPERVDEISLMEMVSLVNSYTNECEDIAKADAQGLAEFVTAEVSDKIQESGNSIFENLMKPFGEKIKKNKKAYATEAVIPSINENFGEEEDDENGSEDESGIEDAGVEDSGSEVIATATADDESNPADSISAGEEPIAIEKPEMAIAPAAQVIAAGAPGVDAAKTVTLDLNNNTISVSMNESISKKLEKIVNKKIEEQLSGKKSPINEGKKSELSIMIDKLVNEAIQKRRDAIEKRLLRK